jgi:hypothetical protein
MIIKFKASEWGLITSRIRKHLEEGASYILDLKKAKKKRSAPQNAYYWGVIVLVISDHTGYTSQEAHQELAGMFLSYTHENGKRFVKSTTELNTFEFEQYAEKCRRWAATELDITIPLPNEITEETWMQLQNIES